MVESNLDMTLLRVLKYREKYEKLIRAVPMKVLDSKTRVLLKDFGKFFESFPEYYEVRFESFWSFFLLAHPKLTDEAVAVWQTMLQRIDKDVSEEVAAGILDRLVSAETAYKLAELIEGWNAGEEIDLYMALRDTVEEYEQQVNKRVKLPKITDDITDLLEEDQNDGGVRFRLECLNESLRPLRPGDFGILAGRPDKGKTTWCCSELTFMAKQLAEQGAGPIIWLNNEGPGKRIIKRLYSSALNLPLSGLLDLRNKGTLHQAYEEAVGGADMIQVYDVHDYTSYEIEDIIKQVQPGLVLFDMIDNVKFGGVAMNGGQRTDQLLEAMYQWARVLGVKHECIVLGTSQISADGDGLAYPTLPMLKDSKTGKQGAADFILTMGASNDPLLGNTRFIGATKNKLNREGAPRDPRCEVVFDAQRGRLNMPGE